MSITDKTKKSDEFWMSKCLELAKTGADINEVPVGAIIVHKDEIVGQAFNRREMNQNPLAHAEILAIEEASRNLGRWRLSGCTLYVSLEPCLMCSGAVNQARIERLVYACSDEKAGGIESVFKVFDGRKLNHAPIIDSGIMAKQSSELLKNFFGEVRKKNKQINTRSEKSFMEAEL